MILLNEMELIRIVDSRISINPDRKIEINKKEMGVRAFNIYLAASKLSAILKSDDKNLYLQLRVEL